ncbi:conserved hypothetical protein [Ricinus communis]|uniref:RNase H type-1 domain-containing protein n=1 Tax=Ricinus communis TaxID=3988 RepID=B9S4N4_RICCO|nr:conserved hypothetical protein [Ricinus communis]
MEGTQFLVFNQKAPNPQTTSAAAEFALLEFHDAMSNNRTNIENAVRESKSYARTWERPPRDRLKFNCDASFFAESLEVGIAVICRNSSGQMVDRVG